MMGDTFFIRGTISIEVDGPKPKIMVTPCAGFLMPNKKKAIMFPLDVNADTAKLVTLPDGKSLALDAVTIKIHMPSLLVIAAQQKAIELRLTESESAWKVVGFVFPT